MGKHLGTSGSGLLDGTIQVRACLQYYTSHLVDNLVSDSRTTVCKLL